MGKAQIYLLPPALVKCWHVPLVAAGGSIRRVWPEETVLAVQGASGFTALDRLEGMGIFEVAMGGLTTRLSVHYGWSILEVEASPQWVSVHKGDWAPWDARLGGGKCFQAQMNLHGLLGRALLASGAVQSECPPPGPAVFAVPSPWTQAAIADLMSPPVECCLIAGDLPAAERHAGRWALDERAVLRLSGAAVRVFSGQGIDPQTRQPVWYVALDSSSCRRRHKAREMAGAIEQSLRARGALRLATAAPDHVASS